ncbi:MAG: hypothetical protein ACXAAO_13100 [Candidatus Thorarchaeota archaeon]|jgi:hypothetical protein
MSRFFKKGKKEQEKTTHDIKESMKASDHPTIEIDVGPFGGAMNLTKAGEALRSIAERCIEAGKPLSLNEAMKRLSLTSNDVMALLAMDKSTAPIMNKRIINYRVQKVGGDSHIFFSY